VTFSPDRCPDPDAAPAHHRLGGSADTRTDPPRTHRLGVLGQREQQFLDQVRGGLVVSCQAPDQHPLRSSEAMARMAEAAVLGGAVAVRVNGTADVEAVRARVDVPIIGLWKRQHPHRPLITPTFESAVALVDAGADVVALETTEETPYDGLALLRRILSELEVPVMADVSRLAEATAAWTSGATIVGTTLSGYPLASQPAPETPDLDLVGRIHDQGVRVAAEGRYTLPEQIEAAFTGGAHCVVVGTAITDPVEITRRLVRSTPHGHPDTSPTSGPA
jgi:N-acylglucosamine-6-phosphate 2-epimerase